MFGKNTFRGVWRMIGGFQQRGLPPHVGIHQPEATVSGEEATPAMRAQCPYCRDQRDAYAFKATWFHIVARGEAGQYEVCEASKLRQAEYTAPPVAVS